MISPTKNNRSSVSLTKLKLKSPKKDNATADSRITVRGEGTKRKSENKTPLTTPTSEKTLSIQTLEFPHAEKVVNKAAFPMVKCTNNFLHRSESKSTSSPTITGSSNSHFDNTNRTFKADQKYSSASTEGRALERENTSSLLSERWSCYTSERQQQLQTSQEMIDSHHRVSEEPKDFNGSQFRKPCTESFVAGASRKFIGMCPSNIEQLAKMSKTRQKFLLTEDPRKVHCLVNPERLHSKTDSKKNEFDILTTKVKQAQNTCATTASESSESFICEVIDLENPLQLDFQGLDYKNTYQKDEQDLQNQRNYCRVKRFMERKRVRAETKVNVEEELHQERLKVPKRFEVRDRNKPHKTVPREDPPKLCKLYRTGDKPLNQQIVNKERERRQERYKGLYLANKARQDRQKEAEQQHLKEREENFGLISADVNLKKIVTDIDALIGRSFKKEMLLRQPLVQWRTFPHTMRDTKLFKREMKPKNREHRDKARVRQEFYSEHSDKDKLYPKADPELRSDTPLYNSSDASKLTEQSADDEDNLKVGKDGSKFKLRGFQFNMTGKVQQRDQPHVPNKEKGCITRDQWLKELLPKREKVKLDVEKGIQKIRQPDDPKLVLFDPNMGYQPPQKVMSAVRGFREKPLGRHYDRVLRKKLKIAQPRLRYSVKKFNLVGYRFGDTTKRLTQIKHPLAQFEMSPLQLETTAEYMTIKALREQQRQREVKEKRLALLGIPCVAIKKSRLQTKCENSSSSSNSEWIPEKQPDLDANDDDVIQTRLKERTAGLSEIMPLSGRTNMPAPKYREPTLRQHPRRCRDYKNQRVPSEIFDQVVQTTQIPYMYRLPPDMMEYSNVGLKKRPYMQFLEARHHHDHWNPIQKKKVDVHYQPILVRPEKEKVKRKTDQTKMENFQKANPPCNQFVDMNLTLPKWDIDEIIRDYKKTSKKNGNEDLIMGTIKIQNLCHQKDLIVRSRHPEELKDLDYPGRREYLQLLHEVKTAVKESKRQTEEYQSDKLLVDKSAVLQDLSEDLRSIESCLTSLSSSVCTNFTNDSGSFLLMEGQEKIPLDFIRKSLVPFEELQRSRFRAEPIDVDQEDVNPFRVLPFSGQKKAQLELSTPKDTFFTFNSRLKNGLRLRLEVPMQNVREQVIGKGQNKYKGMVTTDIDENYVDELKQRRPVKMFNFKTCRSFIKDALRLKFESMLIQVQMVRTKMYDRLNEQHWLDMDKLKLLFEELFAKWEKSEYDAAMAVVYKVKAIYDETDRLKNEFKLLERQQVALNMDIVFIEGHWIRCIMLQNFHYLLGDQEWRKKHDWIHRLPSEELELEGFEDSIMKRSRVNVRQREKDDAWAIKDYYENDYLQNKHPNLIVFPDANSFLQGLENLKAKTFVLLLEMHFTLAIHTEVQVMLETFVEWCAHDLEEKEEYVARKCAKLYFMNDRADWLRHRTMVYLDEPIEESFNDVTFLKESALIAEAWRRIVPANMRGSSEQLQPVDMIAMISDVVIELISKFETIPMEKSVVAESKLRARRNYLRKQSYHACHMERRIEQEMKKVIRNLEPPCRKPKRPGKLSRYYIKKPYKAIERHEKKISDRAKFFFEAFHEGDGDIMRTSEIRDSIAQVDTIQEQIVPFYFDHFLKLNGYTPNYNFKTHVEIRDGPELDRVKVRSVIPEIQERMLQWEVMKKKIMEDHIAQNPKMYINVV